MHCFPCEPGLVDTCMLSYNTSWQKFAFSSPSLCLLHSCLTCILGKWAWKGFMHWAVQVILSRWSSLVVTLPMSWDLSEGGECWQHCGLAGWCVALLTAAVLEMHCSGVFVEYPGMHSLTYFIYDSLQGATTWLFHCSRGQDILTCLLWWAFWSSPSSGSGSPCHTSCHWLLLQPVSLALTKILRYVMSREEKRFWQLPRRLKSSGRGVHGFVFLWVSLVCLCQKRH